MQKYIPNKPQIEEMTKTTFIEYLKQQNLDVHTIQNILTQNWTGFYEKLHPKIWDEILRLYLTLGHSMFKYIIQELAQQENYENCTLKGYDKETDMLRLVIPTLRYNKYTHIVETNAGTPINFLHKINLDFGIQTASDMYPVYQKMEDTPTRKSYGILTRHPLETDIETTESSNSYSVIGYDKDHDYQDELVTDKNYEYIEAVASECKGLLIHPDITFLSTCEEPYDWLEIWENFGTKNERRISVLS